jgi:hypothetical protein
MLNIIKNTINRVFASGVDSDASAFITATGLSGTTQKSAITTLVKDLKSSGLWSKMKAVYPMVTDNYNLLSYTEDFSNALWNKINTTIAANATTNPFGANTATKLIENNGSGSKYIALTTTSTTVSQTYTFSVYLKASERSWAIIGQDTLGTGYFWVNLSNGTFGSGAGTYLSRSITSAGNGWYKITVTYSAASTSADGIVFISSADGVVNYTGNGTNGIYISSPQLELGTSTTSAYQPILTTPSAFMASQMKYNLKDARDLDAAFRLTWSGGWTYSATGATPNGTNAYANPYLNLNIINSGLAHMSYYSRSNTNAGYEWGSIDGWPTTWLAARISGGEQTAFDGQSFSVYSNTDGTGLYLGQKNSSTENSGYKNGTKVLSKTGTVSYASGKNVYLARYETTYGNKQFAFASLGELLSDQENLLLNQITEKYQVALSRGVQAAQSFYYNSAYSNEANTYLYSTQITGTTQVSAINTLINGLKANNLWTKMKAVYPFVTDKTLQADMATQMKFNLVNPQDSDAAFRLAFSGGWTYSTNGAQPNGTNGYADTKLVTGTELGNDISFSIYSRTTGASTGRDIGYDGTFTQGIICQYNGATAYFRNGTDATYTVGTAQGFYVDSKNSTTGNKGYINGINVANSAYQSVITNLNAYIGAAQTVGIPNFYSIRQNSFTHFGSSLTDAEVAILYSLVQQFQTTLSRNI